jgi:hypothetical protein
MNPILKITAFLLLIGNLVFGQKQEYKSLTNNELELIDKLSSTLKDSTIIISPLIIFGIDSTYLHISMLNTKYGFAKKQFEKTLADTFLIKDNKYFEVLSPDSLIAFKIYQEPGYIILDPLFYCIKKFYQKSAICYFRKPIFSKNNSYAIIEYWVSCGNLCGWGEIVLMKKVQGKWSIFKTLVASES